jgi:hypothetical protein
VALGLSKHPCHHMRLICLQRIASSSGITQTSGGVQVKVSAGESFKHQAHRVFLHGWTGKDSVAECNWLMSARELPQPFGDPFCVTEAVPLRERSCSFCGTPTQSLPCYTGKKDLAPVLSSMSTNQVAGGGRSVCHVELNNRRGAECVTTREFALSKPGWCLGNRVHCHHLAGTVSHTACLTCLAVQSS